MSITDLHPLNAAGLVLNGSMLLALVIVIILGRRSMRRNRSRKGVVILLTEPRQCCAFFARLGSGIPSTLPPLTKEDRL